MSENLSNQALNDLEVNSCPAHTPDYDEFSEDDFELERKNYSRLTYRKIHRLRVDGVAVGVLIPALRHDLKKPKHPRVSMIIFSLLSGLLLAGALFVFAMLLINVITPAIAATDGLNSLDNATLSQFTLGLTDVLVGSASTIIILPVILVCALAILIVGYATYYLLGFLGVIKCSHQEMAKGCFVRTLFTNAIVMSIIFLVIDGVIAYGLITSGNMSDSLVNLIIVLACATVYFVAMSVCLGVEKKKSKRIFNDLPQEEQEDFLNHNYGIIDAKRSLRRIKRVDDQVEGGLL